MKIIPYNSNFHLHDRVINSLRVYLDAQISWIDYSFPIVQIGTEMVDEVEVTYPQVYSGDGSTEHYNIRPDFEVGGYYFFEFLDATATDEWEGTDYTFNMIVYARLDKAYPAKANYDYTSELIAEVIGHLKHVSIDARVLGWTINVEEIFTNYSDLERVVTQSLMKHGTAFKITFTIHDMKDCYETVS